MHRDWRAVRARPALAFWIMYTAPFFAHFLIDFVESEELVVVRARILLSCRAEYTLDAGFLWKLAKRVYQTWRVSERGRGGKVILQYANADSSRSHWKWLVLDSKLMSCTICALEGVEVVELMFWSGSLRIEEISTFRRSISIVLFRLIFGRKSVWLDVIELGSFHSSKNFRCVTWLCRFCTRMPPDYPMLNSRLKINFLVRYSVCSYFISISRKCAPPTQHPLFTPRYTLVYTSLALSPDPLSEFSFPSEN